MKVNKKESDKVETINEIIFNLEMNLLKSDTRKSPERISEILAEDFIEFTSSGNEYHYKNGDVFQSNEDNSILNWEIIDFKIKELSSDCMLAMYKVVKHGEVKENKKYSLRSSIWKCLNGNWKMLFHQGTISSPFEI